MKDSVRLTALLIILLLSILVIPVSAAVPQLINYQGRLTNSVRVPLDTTVTLTFIVYGDSLGAINLWTEAHQGVAISDGLFHVLLGSVNPLTESVFDGSKRWLGVQLKGDPAPTTFIPIVSVAYAYRSTKSYTANFALSGVGVGDITSVAADNGLAGGRTSGEAGLRFAGSGGNAIEALAAALTGKVSQLEKPKA